MAHSNYGVCVMANDRMIQWLLPFLNSYYEHHSQLPLYIIPYDEQLKLTTQAAKHFGATILNEHSFSALDAWSRTLYPWIWRKWRRLRKIVSLMLPLEEVIYIDVDTLIFNDFSQLFGHVSRGTCDFLIASISPDSVYRSEYRNSEMCQNKHWFSDGFFLTSRRHLCVDDFFTMNAQEKKIFHRMRQRGGLIAQPLMNYMVHRKDLNIAQLSECIPHASNETFYRAEGLYVENQKAYCQLGREIFFIHWAGGWKSLPSGDYSLDEFWFKHRRLANNKFNF